MSAKNVDKKNRFRSKTVGFRVSPEEYAQMDAFTRLSGLTKQDYMINRALQRDIVVVGNSRTYKALRDLLQDVKIELQRLTANDEVDSELIELIRQIDKTVSGFKEG